TNRCRTFGRVALIRADAKCRLATSRTAHGRRANRKTPGRSDRDHVLDAIARMNGLALLLGLLAAATAVATRDIDVSLQLHGKIGQGADEPAVRCLRTGFLWRRSPRGRL